MSLADVLDEAISSKTSIMIIYHGGSQPGAKREITPLMILGAKLRARDVVSNRAKLFDLAKIELADGQAAPAYVEKQSERRTVSNLLQGKVGELTALGWRVEMTEDSAELFAPRKKEPVIYIKESDSQKSEVLIIGVDGASFTSETTIERSWAVLGPGIAAAIVDPEPGEDLSVRYKKLGAAISAFLREARQHAPKRR